MADFGSYYRYQVDQLTDQVIAITGPFTVGATDAALAPGETFTWNGSTYQSDGVPVFDATSGATGISGGDLYYFSTDGGALAIGDVAGGRIPGATANLVCFLEGTLIATPEGERAVEALAIGDMVLTADGRTVPVKWIGRQHIRNGVFASANLEPVCIAAGALGDGLPHSDLYVTAAHGMIWQGLVVNAGALVNGTTIRFVPLAEMPAAFTWYHIETEAHDEVLANGAPSETFVDYVGRRAFDNHQEYLDLYGAERIIPEMKRPRLSAQRMLPNHLRALLDIAPYGVEIKAEHEALMQRLNAA